MRDGEDRATGVGSASLRRATHFSPEQRKTKKQYLTYLLFPVFMFEIVNSFL
jgi:hypothetical protein